MGKKPLVRLQNFIAVLRLHSNFYILVRQNNCFPAQTTKQKFAFEEKAVSILRSRVSEWI